MKDLLSAELLKLRTTCALWATSAVVLLLAGALPIVVASLAGEGDIADLSPASMLDFVKAPVQLGGAAVLLMGLLSSAGEFRHRTVLVSRLAEPRPLRLLLAKLGAVTLVGVALGIALDLVTFSSSAAVLVGYDVPVEPGSHGISRVLLLTPLLLAAYGVFGVAIGTLLRSTASAVGATLVWAFVIEGVVPVVTGHQSLSERLPSGAFKAVLQDHASAGGPSALTAAGLLAVYAAVLLAAAAVLDRREP
jgi:hypothetical protein